MESKANRVYEDFEPSAEWVPEPLADTLMVYLPGFRKEQLKVQVTSSKNLRISGTRQLNDNIWSRFRNEIPVPSNYDSNGITARFEKGILYVINPKLIVPESPAPPHLPKPTSDQSPKPQIRPQDPPKTAIEEPSKTSSRPGKNPKEDRSDAPLETPKPRETVKPSKEEVHSKPVEAQKPVKPPEETPERAEEETRKPARTGKVEEEKEGKIEKDESGSSRFATENYKKAICGLMKERKKAKSATNIVLAILFALVIGLYMKNAFKAFMESDN